MPPEETVYASLGNVLQVLDGLIEGRVAGVALVEVEDLLAMQKRVEGCRERVKSIAVQVRNLPFTR